MSKILRNTTGADIFISDTGINLPASSSTTLPSTDFPLWAASSDIISPVGTGAVIVNDGTFDLSKADGISLLQGNFKQTDFIASLKTSDRLKVDVQITGDQLIKVDPADTTAGYLSAKVVAESGATTATVINPGGSESLQIGLATIAGTGTYGSASSVAVITKDTKGRVTTAVTTPIQITETQVTNLTTDLGLKADKATTISAGTGLTGGGDLSTNRTISMPAVGTAGTYGSATQTDVITTDTQGRVTAVTPTTIQIAESQVTNLTTDLAAKQPLNANLTSLSANTTAGFLVEIATGAIVSRTLTQGAGVTITNPAGTAANPTVAAATPYLDHFHGAGNAAPTQYNATQLRKYTNASTTDANGRVTLALTTTGITGGTALFSSILDVNAIIVDGSGTAIQAAFVIIESFSATAIVLRAVRGTSTGVLIGGTVVSAQFAGAGYTMTVSITGVHP